MTVRAALHRLRHSRTSNAGPVYRTQETAIGGAVGCAFCKALKELLRFDWDADRRRFTNVADTGECFFVEKGIPFVRIADDDEYGLFASSLFSVGRNVHPLLHQTAPPTWVFLCSADRGVSLSRPDVPKASRAAAVKLGRRPPAQPARSGLDGGEHGASLEPAGHTAEQ